MLTGQIDISITYNLGVDPGLVSRKITNVYPHILLYPKHPLVAFDKIRIEDLSGKPLVLVDQGRSLRHMVGLFRAQQLTANIEYRAATYEIMRSMVANGLGIGLSYTRSRATTSHDGKPLIDKEIVDGYTAEPIVIVSNPSNPLSSFAGEIEDLIAAIST